jgi:hypothetical protein
MAMDPATKLSVTILVILGIIVELLGCGGGSGQGTGTQPPPPPTITTAISPTTATVNADGTSTVAFTATATVANTSATPTFMGSVSSAGGTITFAAAASAGSGKWTSTGTYTAPSSVPSTDPATISVTASAAGVTSNAATAQVTINAVATLPTVTVTGNPATAILGGAEAVSFTASGNPAPTVTCTSSQFGNMTVSGNGASVPVPTPAPTNWTDTSTCTAKNSAGQAQGSATITLQYPVPTITSVDPEVVYCAAPCAIGPVTITGSGFYPGGILTVTRPGSTSNPPETITLSAGEVTSFNQIQLGLTYPVDPNWVQFSYASPTTGNGGGTSNTQTTLFTGNLNTMTFTANDVCRESQATGTVYCFKLSDLSLDNTYANFEGTQLAYDDVTKALLLSAIGPAVVTVPGEIQTLTNSPPMGLGAGNGKACFAEPQDNTLGAFKVSTTSNPTAFYTALPGVPWNVAMTSLNSTPNCVVFSVETDVLNVVPVSATSLGTPSTVNLPGLTPQSKLPPGVGEWSLAVTGSKASLLADHDGSVTLVDLSTTPPSVVKQVSPSGIPFRIAMNPKDGSTVVAMADLANAQTTFARIDSKGNITTLTATFTLACTDFGISSDGTTLYCGNENQIQKANNQ